MQQQESHGSAPAKGAELTGLPRHRYITSAQAAEAQATYERNWAAWLAAHPDDEKSMVAYYAHKGIWAGAHGSETITVRD